VDKECPRWLERKKDGKVRDCGDCPYNEENRKGEDNAKV